MKLLISNRKQPLLQLNSGQIINLNTLEYTLEYEYQPIKAGGIPHFSKHRNNKFLEKAGKCFCVAKVTKNYGITWYKLEAKIVLFCIIQGDTLQLIGNYPVYILKLLYRYINSL